jgi:hypothetical protein
MLVKIHHSFFIMDIKKLQRGTFSMASILVAVGCYAAATELELAGRVTDTLQGKGADWLIAFALVVSSGALLFVLWNAFNKIDSLIKSHNELNQSWIAAQSEEAKMWRDEIAAGRLALEKHTIALSERPCAMPDFLNTISRTVKAGAFLGAQQRDSEPGTQKH